MEMRQGKSCIPSPSTYACMTPRSLAPALSLAHLLVMILQTGNQLILLATNFELALLQLLLQLGDLQALQCFRPCSYGDLRENKTGVSAER